MESVQLSRGGRGFVLILSLVFLPSLLSAQYSTDVFNTHEQSARSFGAAGAYVSFADDSSAFNLNPAGLSRNLEDRFLGVGYRIYEKRKDFGLRAHVIDAKTENPLAWGFQFNWARTKEDWHQDYRLGLSFNYKNFLMIGTSSVMSRYSPTSVTTGDYWQYANDAGGLIYVGDMVAIGVTVKNFIRTKAATAPYRLLGGASLNLKWGRLSIEGERNFTQKITIGRSGVEIKPFKVIVIRAGGYYGQYQKSVNEKGYTLGASFVPGNRLSIDFGYHDRIKSDERSFVAGISFRI